MDKKKEKSVKVPHGKHPNSLKNLIPQKPGEPGINPLGRPRGSVSFVKLFRKMLAEENADGHSLAKAMTAKMIKQALEGGYKQQNLIIERVDGKVPFRLAGSKGEDLFPAMDTTIEKIFSNPKAMALAIKLSNCVNTPSPEKKNGTSNDNGDDTGGK